MQRTSSLSGGEHQRVAIARALVQDPVLMLADEPVASLDPALSQQTLELLCRLAEESGVTLLCSLHQPHLAEHYFERIIEMRSGEIVDERKGEGRLDAPELYPALGGGDLMPGLGPLFTLLRQFFPPELSASYLKAALTPLEQTIAMAAGGILIAVVIGMITGIWVGAGLPGHRGIYAALASVRSIPDLTLGILCVVVVGIGPAAGMLALAIFYSAAVGKIFADLFRSADRGPLQALRATGASRLSVACMACCRCVRRTS